MLYSFLKQSPVYSLNYSGWSAVLIEPFGSLLPLKYHYSINNKSTADSYIYCGYFFVEIDIFLDNSLLEILN